MSRSRSTLASSSAVARHRRERRRPQTSDLLRRGTLATVVVAFAALLGLSGTAALWSSSTTIAVASVTAGSIDITQSTLADATVVYASGTTRKTTALTLKNTGSSSASVSAAAVTSGDGGLAGAVVVNLWKAASAAACTDSASTAGDSGSWAALKNLPSSIAAGETQVYCLRTTLSDAGVKSYTGKSYAATLTLTAKLGGWTSAVSTAPVTQSVATTAKITCTDNSGWGLLLSWSNPSGTPSSVRYQVRTGSTVLSDNGHYWWPSDWVLPSAFSSLAKGATYPIEVVRTDTGATVAVGSIRYDSSGRTWCA